MERCRTSVAVLICLLSSAALAQPGDAQSSAKISFSFSFPGATPSSYSISVDAAGHGEYESTRGDVSPQRPAPSPYSGSAASGDGAATQDTAAETYRTTFELSEPARQRLFSLAASANYFDGSFDYKKKRLANTGAKTLGYSDSARHFQTTFNYSANQSISELTQLFQGLSATLEAGRRLDYLYHHNRLGLDEELKRDDELSSGGQLSELGVLAPLLRQIADDGSVMHVARQHARKLLDRAATQGQPK